MDSHKQGKPLRKIVSLDEALDPRELEKIREYQSDTTGAYPVDQEWVILAEWLKLAGYQAYLDAKNDAKDDNGNLIITMPEILTLLEANRKIEAINQYLAAESVMIGAGTAWSGKQATTVWKSLTKHILKKAKVQN